ncbi:MAG TPA: hypothetical protein VFZ98_07905, partial [Vicinamibacterales bacterium]
FSTGIQRAARPTFLSGRILRADNYVATTGSAAARIWSERRVLALAGDTLERTVAAHGQFCPDWTGLD